MSPPARPKPPAPEPAVLEVQRNLEQFRRGLESMALGHPGPLEQLAQSAPDSIWGMTAERLVDQHHLVETGQELSEQLQEQVADLQQQLKTIRQDLGQAHQHNRELQNKLDELARVLVELEKHAR